MVGFIYSHTQNIKKDRVQKLTTLAKEMRDEFTRKNINEVYDVIVEQKYENYFVGHTPNFIKCYIESNNELLSNQIVKVKIKKPQFDGAIAEIVG